MARGPRRTRPTPPARRLPCDRPREARRPVARAPRPRDRGGVRPRPGPGGTRGSRAAPPVRTRRAQRRGLADERAEQPGAGIAVRPRAAPGVVPGPPEEGEPELDGQPGPGEGGRRRDTPLDVRKALVEAEDLHVARPGA